MVSKEEKDGWMEEYFRVCIGGRQTPPGGVVSVNWILNPKTIFCLYQHGLRYFASCVDLDVERIGIWKGCDAFLRRNALSY